MLLKPPSQPQSFVSPRIKKGSDTWWWLKRFEKVAENSTERRSVISTFFFKLKSTFQKGMPRRIPAPPPSEGSIPRIGFRKQKYAWSGCWNMLGPYKLEPNCKPAFAGLLNVGLLCRVAPKPVGQMRTAFCNAAKSLPSPSPKD